jgi:tocopherol cyclase
MFQGNLKSRRYFEGWYFKNVDRAEKRIMAVIPGVSLVEGGSSAFIQVLDGTMGESHYIEYPLKDFWASQEDFLIRIGVSQFSHDGLQLDIHGNSISVEGSISFKDPVKWNGSTLRPGVMGWYSYVPFMECYHGVVSMNHGLTGALTVNGENINFAGGKGYSEKDWGRSFPSSHIWIQSNHFQDETASVMLSVARIPWLGSAFTGYLIILKRGDELLNMSTYTGSKMKRLQKEENRVHITVENRKYILDLTAYRGSSKLLKAPKMGEMKGRIAESIDSVINLRLADKKTKEIIYEDTGRNAGFELNDDENELTNSMRR